MKKLTLLLAIASLSSACTWVKVSDEGTGVAVANMANVNGCEKLRNVHVKVKGNIGPMDRNSNKVATELANLARNEAISFGGDTVVPTSEISEGKQSFGVYKCQ